MQAPRGNDCRPTPDRLRESLFSILQPRLEGATFLDVYAGSGAVGIEALSRGAARAIFVERSRAHAEILRGNLQALGIASRAQVFVGKASDVLTHQTADVIFLDPPYDQPEEYERVIEALAKRPAPRLLLIQHSPRQAVPAQIGEAERFRELKQGDNWVTFYQPPC